MNMVTYFMVHSGLAAHQDFIKNSLLLCNEEDSFDILLISVHNDFVSD